MFESIRSTSMLFADLTFFVMAGIGILSGLTPATCCWRAFSGAVLFYIAVTIAGKSIISIIISSMVDSKTIGNGEDEQ